MPTYDLVTERNCHRYPGHFVDVRGNEDRITGVVHARDVEVNAEEEPLESAIHHAMLIRQQKPGPIAIKDELGLWPERLGKLAPWDEPALRDRS